MAARKQTPKKPVKSATQKRRPKREVDDVPELTRAEARELERRVKDLEDRTRYLLLSPLGPKFVLYYNLAEDTYGWNDPTHATLFKRHAAAQAIKQLLDSDVSIVQCRADKHGALVKKSVSFKGMPRGRRSK
jgi:hypothetical protein